VLKSTGILAVDVMKKNISQIIEIPEGVNAGKEGREIIVKGKEGEIKKKIETSKILLLIEDKKIKLESKNATKRERKTMNSLKAHIKNMIKGVQEQFEYQLKICSSHFPISVELKDKEAIIKNFLGEKVPRKAKILEGVNIENKGNLIVIKSIDKELAGQTAANFEKATTVRARDRRIFQDGIFIIQKAGRKI